MTTAPNTTTTTGATNASLDDDERLSATFSALAHPTRRAILARLAEGEASVSELSEPFDATMPAISRHLRVLEGAGLIVQGRRAQYRPCRLDPTPLRELATWADQYRHVWEQRLDQLDAYVRSIDHEPRHESDSTP